MTFSDIKAAILLNARNREMCSAYQAIYLAATEQDIIDAGISELKKYYQQGIITDALLLEFNQSNLNTNGIYVTGTFTLTNPANSVYIFNNANVTISMTGNNQVLVLGFSQAVITVNSAGSSYTHLEVDGCTLDLNLSDYAFARCVVANCQDATVTADDDSTAEAVAYRNTALTLVGNSYISFKGYYNSVTTGTGDIEATIFQQATFTNTAP